MGVNGCEWGVGWNGVGWWGQPGWCGATALGGVVPTKRLGAGCASMQARERAAHPAGASHAPRSRLHHAASCPAAPCGAAPHLPDLHRPRDGVVPATLCRERACAGSSADGGSGSVQRRFAGAPHCRSILNLAGLEGGGSCLVRQPPAAGGMLARSAPKPRRHRWGAACTPGSRLGRFRRVQHRHPALAHVVSDRCFHPHLEQELLGSVLGPVPRVLQVRLLPRQQAVQGGHRACRQQAQGAGQRLHGISRRDERAACACAHVAAWRQHWWEACAAAAAAAAPRAAAAAMHLPGRSTFGGGGGGGGRQHSRQPPSLINESNLRQRRL